jgi:hypothetical protein
MDLRVYYSKIREVESKITDEFPIVVSQETADGGKEGTKTEVTRRIAAQLVVDGTARLAVGDELKQHRELMAEAQRTAEQAAKAAKLEISVLSSAELAQLRKDALKQSKG